jgi:hypothetical protein
LYLVAIKNLVVKYLAFTVFFLAFSGLLSCSKDNYGINIKTDKKKYSKGEIMVISAYNNSDLPVNFFCCGIMHHLRIHSWTEYKNSGVEVNSQLGACEGIGRGGYYCQIDENSNHETWFGTQVLEKGTYVFQYKLIADGDTIYVNTIKLRIE